MRGCIQFLNDEDIISDISITNPNAVNIECGLIYANIMRKIYNGENKEQIQEYLTDMKCKNDAVQEAIINTTRSISPEEIKVGYAMHYISS